MKRTIINLMKDHSGDENITKMVWIAIVFIVGAILLVMVSTAFNGPIHDWYQKVINGWFDKNGSNGVFPGYSTNTVSGGVTNYQSGASGVNNPGDPGFIGDLG